MPGNNSSLLTFSRDAQQLQHNIDFQIFLLEDKLYKIERELPICDRRVKLATKNLARAEARLQGVIEPTAIKAVRTEYQQRLEELDKATESLDSRYLARDAILDNLAELRMLQMQSQEANESDQIGSNLQPDLVQSIRKFNRNNLRHL
jgi:hypothetical protein